MIDSFQIKDIATYDSVGISCNNLAKVNFIYGANGSGKTTISKLLKHPQSNCKIDWLDGCILETYVYNKDFKERNIFHDTFEGVFTIGEKDISNEKSIIEKREKKEKFLSNIKGYSKTLKEKRDQLGELESESVEKVWVNSTVLDNSLLRGCLSGYLNSKRNFFKRNIMILVNNIDSVSLEYLEKTANSVNREDLSIIPSIQRISTDIIEKLESDNIWGEVIVGREDLDISNLIKNLGIDDWVNNGLNYIQEGDNTCPFCQKKTIDDDFIENIENYFDNTYREKSALVKSLSSKYEREVKNLNLALDQIVFHHEMDTPYIFDLESFKQITIQLKTIFELNINAMRNKVEKSNHKVYIKNTLDEIGKIQELISNSNIDIQRHNGLVNNIKESKEELRDKVWSYTVDCNREILNSYKEDENKINKAITSIEGSIRNARLEIEKIDKDIEVLTKIPTTTGHTIRKINSSLISFGFTGFLIAEVDDKKYQLQRGDGTLAKDTLSEGEVTFITFLYFYHLCKGGLTESTVKSDRIIVIDDPISSLDSNILFIVSSLVKDIIKDVKSNECYQFKQLILLTHNVYFHKEASFLDGKAKSENAVKFWKLRKIHNITSIVDYKNDNPINSSYELLWRELEEGKGSLIAIQNSMRRIIENYFKILGGLEYIDILEKFDCYNERLICQSLICWINDGSHCIPDDLYIDGQFSSVDEYRRVFKAIFERTDHISHYNMMIRNDGNELL